MSIDENNYPSQQLPVHKRTKSIKQKLFNFSTSNSKTHYQSTQFPLDKHFEASEFTVDNNQQQTIAKDNIILWKPVLQYKRLYDTPKFLFSMQRRKAKIIATINQKPIQNKQVKVAGMVGSKYRHRNKSHLQITKDIKNGDDLQKIVEANERIINQQKQLKNNKIPYMNFSLYCMIRKDRNNEEIKKTDSLNYQIKSARFTPTSNRNRDKGSESGHVQAVLSENIKLNKKNALRPRTGKNKRDTEIQDRNYLSSQRKRPASQDS